MSIYCCGAFCADLFAYRRLLHVSAELICDDLQVVTDLQEQLSQMQAAAVAPDTDTDTRLNFVTLHRQPQKKLAEGNSTRSAGMLAIELTAGITGQNGRSPSNFLPAAIGFQVGRETNRLYSGVVFSQAQVVWLRNRGVVGIRRTCWYNLKLRRKCA